MFHHYRLVMLYSTHRSGFLCKQIERSKNPKITPGRSISPNADILVDDRKGSRLCENSKCSGCRGYQNPSEHADRGSTRFWLSAIFASRPAARVFTQPRPKADIRHSYKKYRILSESLYTLNDSQIAVFI